MCHGHKLRITFVVRLSLHYASNVKCYNFRFVWILNWHNCDIKLTKMTDGLFLNCLIYFILVINDGLKILREQMHASIITIQRKLKLLQAGFVLNVIVQSSWYHACIIYIYILRCGNDQFNYGLTLAGEIVWHCFRGKFILNSASIAQRRNAIN